MKKLYRPILKGSNWVLAGLLSLLGFPSCGDNGSGGLEMYGTPSATYSIRGKVQNAAKEAIPDIKIQFLTEHSGDGKIWHDTISSPVLTNSRGEFEGHFVSFPTSDIRVIATDIDGPANGSYSKDSIDIKINAEEYTGDKGAWNKGTVYKENINLELKEKKTDE